MATVLRDKPFYDRSGGGITLSGGEPFMNSELAHALFKASHEQGIHTAVETCLHVPGIISSLHCRMSICSGGPEACGQ